MASLNTATHFLYAIPADRPAGRWDGQTIVMLNHKRPLAKRREARRVVGPLLWIVPELDAKREGRGFYFDRNGEIGDATFSLRIREANDYLRHSRLSHTTGYFADPDYRDGTIIPYVVALPHGRGFWPAYGEGPGMWGCVEFDTYATPEDAAYAAHQLAENAALRAQEERDAAEDEDEEACTIEYGTAPCGRDECVCMDAIA